MTVRRARSNRDDIDFRHSSPLARLLSVLVAFAIATLLAFGGNAAYADDVTPAPDAGAAGAVDPGPTDAPSASDSTSADPTPSGSPAAGAGAGSMGGGSLGSGSTKSTSPTKSAATTKSATSTKSAGTTTSAGSAKAADTTKSFTAQFGAIVSSALASQCDPQHDPVLIGTFEMDGNTCLDDPTKEDWDTTGAHTDDGAKDTTAYTQGDSESTPASGWHTGGSSQGKDDITDAWSKTELISGEVWTFFAIHRVADNGTTTYDVELNQQDNSAPQRPTRTVGDLLLQFSVNGTGPLAFDKAYEWTSLPLADPLPTGCFRSGGLAFGWCPLNTVVAPNFISRVSTDGLFAEGAINLSALARANGGICTGNFGQLNIRTVASESHTAALQDYVAPFDVAIPSTCGTIVINKFDDANTPVGGAHFTISPDPTPGSNAAGPIALVDGGTGDADNTADGVITISPAQAGSYTVVETQAPPGYLLPADTDQTIVLASGAGETATFNFHDPLQWDALTATKTANATYSARYAWSVSKEVSADGQDPWVADSSLLDPLVKNVPTNGDPTNTTMSYRVKVTQGARTASAYQVAGNISVTNPNDGAVTAAISDALPGATCLVAGDATHTVAVPSGTTPYAYVCTFAGTPTQAQLSGDNTATVSWDKSDYPQAQADIGAAGDYTVSPTAPYAFGAETTATDKTVTITDDHHVFPGGFQITWTAAGTVTTSDVYTIPFQAPAGSCSQVLTNTATVTGSDSGVLGTDSASGKVCAASNLTITRMDARGFTRTFPWAIEKSTSTPQINVGDQAHYSVTVTAGDGVDSDWAMSGTITAHNPNDFESVSVTSVPVSYTGGGTCSVTASFPVVIAAGGSHDFAYTCSFGGVQPDYAGSVNATVNWDQAAASTPASSTDDSLPVTVADWDTTLVNDTVTVHDDHANGEDVVLNNGDPLSWADVHAMPNHQIVLSYDVDLADTPADGACDDLTNTVWIIGDGDAQLDSDGNAENNQATVKLCNPTGPSVTDTAVGDFTRTYHWKIDKFIDGDQKSQTVTTDDATATFDYLVEATPLDAVDTGWTVTGTVDITNENSDPAIDPISVTDVQEVLDLGTVSNCVYDTTLPFDLASGEHAAVGFTCTLDPTPDNDGAVPPAYLGSHHGSATWDGTTTVGASDALTWNDPTEVDKTIAVYDDKVTEGAAPVHLGDAVWNATGTPTTFDYQLTFTVPAGTEGSCAPPFENLAWLGGDGVTPTDLQSGATATICVPAVLPPIVPPVKPPVVEPPLPDTGGPDAQLVLWGLLLLVTGGATVLISARRRERRS